MKSLKALLSLLLLAFTSIGCNEMSAETKHFYDKPVASISSLLPKTRSTPITVTGEVVDAWCCASHVMDDGRGEKHKTCAISCVSGGASVGILDDQGNLYIAAKHDGYTGCKDLLLPYVSKRVRAEGWVATYGGCRLLKISSVKPLS